MPKNWTILSLSPREWLAHFARIAENWSAEDLLLTPPEWQFRDRPGSHRELVSSDRADEPDKQSAARTVATKARNIGTLTVPRRPVPY